MTEALSKMNIEDAIEKMITPNGKHMEVVKVSNTSLYALRFKQGGALPKDEGVDGMFTKPEYAVNAAKDYIRKFWDKVEKDSKPLSNASRKARETEE